MIDHILGHQLVDQYLNKHIEYNNIKKAFPDYNSKEFDKIKSSMWNNYGIFDFPEYIRKKT